jgi:hypothetical protein
VIRGRVRAVCTTVGVVGVDVHWQTEGHLQLVTGGRASAAVGTHCVDGVFGVRSLGDLGGFAAVGCCRRQSSKVRGGKVEAPIFDCGCVVVSGKFAEPWRH